MSKETAILGSIYHYITVLQPIGRDYSRWPLAAAGANRD
jgi:hypothetical protein